MHLDAATDDYAHGQPQRRAARHWHTLADAIGND